MILIDTNVVSEVMKVAPADAVVGWLNDQDSSSLFISTTSIGEIEYGLRILPDGKRRTHLRERFEHFIDQAFAMRIVPFDETAAVEYGDIMGLRKELGRPLSVPDGQIAAITRSRGYALATRNIRDFEDCGLALINPFENP
ncbi:MAG: type II toxin-antitoxin system VapC family toxin [Gammaproteobacteria bacterium]|nr:type II toxin-antitoxin system VapC family toxin [Gammaproteobacteria bacterium]